MTHHVDKVHDLKDPLSQLGLISLLLLVLKQHDITLQPSHLISQHLIQQNQIRDTAGHRRDKPCVRLTAR